MSLKSPNNSVHIVPPLCHAGSVVVLRLLLVCASPTSKDFHSAPALSRSNLARLSSFLPAEPFLVLFHF